MVEDTTAQPRTEADGSPEAERARLDEMRAEVARLEARLGVTTAGTGRPASGPVDRSWWRGPVIVVALTLLAIIAPLAVVATWAHDEVKDTDRYVATVAPLASDPAVQRAISDRLTELIVSNLDVRAVTNQAVEALSANRDLPPTVVTGLQALSVPLANGVESFVGTRVQKLVESQRFADAWEQANRVAHTQMVAVLTGETGNAVQVQGDTVTLNLGVLLDEVKAQLVSAGFTLADRIPTVNAEFTLVQSADLEKAQNGFRLLSALARALPIIALLLLGTAIAISRRRRRTLIAGALVVAGSMVLLGGLLNGFRSIYLDAVPTDQLPADAAAVIYDQLVQFIRLALRAVLVLFLALAVVAWVSGPGPRPVAVRRATGRVVDSVRHRSDAVGLDTGSFGRFLGHNLVIIRVAIAGLVVLAYILADHPTGAWTLGVIAIAAVVLLIVELLARTGPAEPSLPLDESAPAA
jgi:hypothetical protein